MNLRDAATIVRHYIKADIPVALWGAPGIGKTEMGHQVAGRLDDCAIHVEPLNLYESVDLRGLPRDRDGVVVWSLPDMFAKLRALSAHKTAILFLDEWNTCTSSVLVCAAQLIHLRRIGPHELPGNVRIIAAGNRQSDRASANRVPTMLNNRMAHVDVEADAKIWREDWASVPGNCDPVVDAFIGFRPLLIHDMRDKDARAFPSPRSWAQVSKIAGAPEALLHALTRGLVGETASGEFMAFVSTWRHVPKLADVLRDPEGFPVPADDQPALRYATSVMLSAAATRANFAKIIAYLDRMPEDIGVTAVIEATQRDKTLMQTQAFTGWCALHEDVQT